MKTLFGKVVGSLFFLISISFLKSGELPKDFWVSEEAQINTKPKQIWVDSFSLETAAESIDKTGREYHLFKTEMPVRLQSAVVKSLMKIAVSKPLWVTPPPQDIWIIKGNITFIGDSVVEQGFWRSMTKSLNSSLGIKRLRTEVFVYDTSVSKDHYVLKFQTGFNGENESPQNIEDTAETILETLQSYLHTVKR
jgi:hypothetical protein